MRLTAPPQRAPGDYVLVLQARTPLVVQVGALGPVTLECGYFLYVGSARGPGGVAARVMRHLRTGKRSHWHIDYLTAVLPVVAVWHAYVPTTQEARWVRLLGGSQAIRPAVPGFGASDSRERSHLFHGGSWSAVTTSRSLLEVDPGFPLLSWVPLAQSC